MDQTVVPTDVPPIDANKSPILTEQVPKKTLPKAVLQQVQIPNWLDNKDEFDLSNLTLDNLVELAKLSHAENHDFFPENQNTLFYVLKAKEQGADSAEIDELLTTIHASLYDQAEQAIREYDAQTLIALTARLKSIAPDDPKIQPYTNQISVIYTLNRLKDEIELHIQNNRIYEANQNDALHTLMIALNMDTNFQPLLQLKDQIITTISQRALRAAQELDFSIADEEIAKMNQLDANHPLTLQTINDIQEQKQNRFAYLDQQFYAAINNLNLTRAQDMIDELSELEIATTQISGYENLYAQTKLYGPYKVSDEFNDFLPNGVSGPTMVVIPTGQFIMGSQTGPKHQRPAHSVTIAYGFAVSKFEITVAEFQQFIHATNYKTTAEQNNRTKIYDEGTGRFKDKFNINWKHDYLGKSATSNLPVIHISWEDAKAYTEWLKQSTNKNYRLLSESEFEYLLSAGNNYTYPWGNGDPEQVYGNFTGSKDQFKRSRIRWREGFNNYQDGYWGPAAVGTFIKSLYGLHDLSGNVMEWVEDCWHDSYTRAPDDGSAWINPGCENKVIRGGSWASAIETYQTHHRIKAESNLTDPRIGFRVALTFEY